MIRRLSANKDYFTPIEFRQGFNVIIADRAPGSSDRHSRNARGKTTLIHAINYCLGGNLNKSLKPLVNNDWEFSLRFDIFGDTIDATRHLKHGSKIRINVSGPASNTIWSSYRSADGTISLPDWKFLLGLGLFRLDEIPGDGAQKLSPRTLISYIIRVDPPRDPTKILAQQPAWSSRQHVSYLLGLDWRFVHDLSSMKDREETLKAIQFASESRILPGVVHSESDLLMQKNEAAQDLERSQDRADRFQVIDDPNDVVRESDQLAEEIRELRNASVVDTRLLDLYRDSLSGADADVSEDLETIQDLYSELGRAFNPSVLERFDRVAEFHETIILNRRRFLEEEVRQLTRRQEGRERRLTELGSRRRQLLARLDSGGALDELVALQSEIARAQARVEELDRQLTSVREISTAQEDLSVDRAQKRQDARRALDSDRRHLDQVAARFDSMMRELYDRNGVLTVEVDDLGYQFKITVSGSSSSGITRIQLFCFDLTLLTEGERNHHPGFLIHDSPVFDGVDPRQVAGAMSLAQRAIEETGGQYILTLNSNDVPERIRTESWFTNAVRRRILDTEVGGAMGVQF